jgi:hypothetical protein
VLVQKAVDTKKERINRRKTIFLMLFYIVCSIYAFNAFSASDIATTAGEYEVKAAYIYNFAKFIEWPKEVFTDDTSPFVVGIVGEDPFNGTIDAAFADKSFNNRKFIIKRYKASDEIDFCHILFISSSEEKRMTDILLKANTAGTLTVGDGKSFFDAGGIINFVLVESKVRFEINLGAAGKAGLKISSKLLKLATLVKGNQPEGK